MRKQLVTLAVAGSLGLTGAVLISPTLASAATGTPAPAQGSVTDRVTALKQALSGLVGDKTLTQAQADRVAQTLADKLPARGAGGPGGRRGPGGPGGAHLSPDDTAAALGLTVDELRTAREAGKTLSQIAAGKGISRGTLVDTLVAAAEADLAEDVKGGRITQAQADRVSSRLTARITEQVDRVGGPHGGPGGRRGDHDGDGPAAPRAASPTPSATAGA